MSWMGLTLMERESAGYAHELEAKTELSKLGHIAFLRRYIAPHANMFGRVGSGRRIDEGLVEFLGCVIQEAKRGIVKYEEVTSILQELEEGMEEVPALASYKEFLRKHKEVPLASETYLTLAKRHVNREFSLGVTRSRRLPSGNETREFARAVLFPFMIVKFWDMDWSREGSDRIRADSWLQERDQEYLSLLIEESRLSWVDWDALILILQDLQARCEVNPKALLAWSAEAISCVRKRPEQGPAPRHRRRKVGYTIRDNEIRHCVQLLKAVGANRETACGAVEEAFPIDPVKQEKKKTLTAERLMHICAKPSTTLGELGMDITKFVEPKLYEHWHG